MDDKLEILVPNQIEVDIGDGFLFCPDFGDSTLERPVSITDTKEC